jgi:hypothetical protein
LSNSVSLHATTAAASLAFSPFKVVKAVAIKAACAVWLVMAVARAVVLVVAVALRVVRAPSGVVSAVAVAAAAVTWAE